MIKIKATDLKSKEVLWATVEHRGSFVAMPVFGLPCTSIFLYLRLLLLVSGPSEHSTALSTN